MSAEPCPSLPDEQVQAQFITVHAVGPVDQETSTCTGTEYISWKMHLCHTL